MSLHKKSSLPNLFIIGAMKSGTTSLHEYLDEHPDIFMSKVKEPGYFARCVNYYPKDYDWYESLFAAVKNELIIGESSTHYTKLPVCDGVVERLWQYNPEARFIYLMRHPVKRAISHYWHNVRKGEELSDILTAFKAKKEYIAYSDYAYQLQPYISRFGRNKIYILTFENLISNTGEELRKIFNWLGVDADFAVKTTNEVHNALPEKFKKIKGRGLLNRLRYSAAWNVLSPLIPNKIKAYAITLSEEVTVKSTDNEAKVHEALKPIFTEKVRLLERLLDTKFDIWEL